MDFLGRLRWNFGIAKLLFVSSPREVLRNVNRDDVSWIVEFQWTRPEQKKGCFSSIYITDQNPPLTSSSQNWVPRIWRFTGANRRSIVFTVTIIYCQVYLKPKWRTMILWKKSPLSMESERWWQARSNGYDCCFMCSWTSARQKRVLLKVEFSGWL